MLIYDSEIKVLETLWEVGAIKAAELTKILNEKIGWKRNTSYTVITKCVEKGFIERTDPNFVCKAAISREDVQNSFLTDVTEKLFDSSNMELIKTMLQNKTFSTEELDEIKEIIDKKRS